MRCDESSEMSWAAPLATGAWGAAAAIASAAARVRIRLANLRTEATLTAPGPPRAEPAAGQPSAHPCRSPFASRRADNRTKASRIGQ